MSLSAAVIDALVASGATAEQLAAAMKASLAEQEARKEAKRANNAERQRRFKARQKGESNADNALPDVTDVITPAPSFPPNPPNTPTPVSNNTRARNGTRLADDFEVPTDWIEWATKERGWPRKEAEAEAANFVDYWHAKPGKDGRKSDWPATWRNWVRNSRRASVVPFQRGGAPPGNGPTLAEIINQRTAQGAT